MTSVSIARSVWCLSGFGQRVAERLRALEQRVVAAFFRLADKRIPGEWIFVILGAIALAAFLLVLFLEPYRR